MYDCLETDDCLKNHSTATPNVTHTKPAAIERIHLAHHWPQHNRLRLKLASHTPPHRLNLAYAAATSFGLATHNLPDGSLLILDLSLNEALLFQNRFNDLLAQFEPARPFPRR
ncbi:hypothetical protein [Chitinibacter sp. S2-10]|uniref:hypothetical protein n=1 Tax=Chitinibacter sp. S2-10 TaxID=3373597 RepID=UPI0039772D00